MPTEQLTPEPTPDDGVRPWPSSLHTPGAERASLDLATLATTGVLALLIAFLVLFPSTIFNKTVEANYTEIQGWIAGAKGRWDALLSALAIGPLAGMRGGLGALLGGQFGLIIFLVLSALVYGFLSPSFGLDAGSLSLFLGMLLGLTLIVLAFDLPLRFYHRRRSAERDGGSLQALWWTLPIALVFVIVSRLADFQPGYLYGLIISIVFASEISAREEGVGNWLASAWLLGLSFIAWIVLILVRQGGSDSAFMTLVLETGLVTFVVAGIETIVVGLLPMRFMPGHSVFGWRKGMWVAVFALAIFGYLLILLDPANGYMSNDSQAPMLVGVIFLVVVGVVSLGTWAYFRYRPKRAGPGSPTLGG